MFKTFKPFKVVIELNDSLRQPLEKSYKRLVQLLASFPRKRESRFYVFAASPPNWMPAGVYPERSRRAGMTMPV